MSKVRIMVVEDEGIEAMDIKREIESYGFTVPYIAKNGKEAIEKAKELMPDLIVMDIMLAGETNGIEVTNEIKNLKIPVVYLTAHSENSTFQKAKLTEPDGYIFKPFESKDLRYTVELAIYKNNIAKKFKSMEEQFKLLADNSRDMIYRMNIPDGGYEYVNPAAETITGYSLKEFYSSSRLLKNVIHPEFKDYYQRTWNNLLNGDETPFFEYKIITKSGEEKWLKQSNNLVKDSNCKPVAIEGIVTDITESKECLLSFENREESFKEEHNKFIRAQKIAKTGIWENELSTNKLKWSEEMYRILGFPLNSKVNLKEVLDIFPKEELKRFNDALNDAIKNNTRYSNDYKIIRPDGKVRYIHDEGQIIRNNEGVAVSMFGTTQDITARKKAELALKKSENKFRNFVETTPDIIWEIDSNGVFTYISPQIEDILGYSPKQILGKTMFSLIKPDSLSLVKEAFKDHVQKNDEYNQLTVPVITSNGKEIILEIQSLKLTESDYIGFRGTARDITEKTKSTNELINTVQEKNILLKEVHHRVKNNMQIISSLLNLQIEHIDNDDSVNILKESQNRVKTMSMIHEKLYQTKNFNSIDQSEYITSIINGLLYSYSVNKRIFPLIDVDPVNLNIETSVPCGLIINELVSNSIKHGFPNNMSGTILIALKPVENGFELKIADNGVGFPKDINFKKTHTLGLELVNNLVTQLDGEIEMESSDGTEFKITFSELKYKDRII